MIIDILNQHPELNVSLYHRSARAEAQPLLKKDNHGVEILDCWESVGKSLVELYAASNIISSSAFNVVGEASRALHAAVPQICELLCYELHASNTVQFGKGIPSIERNQLKTFIPVAYTFIGAFCYLKGFSNTLNQVLLVYAPANKFNFSLDKDEKTLIQELYQAQKKPIPTYRLEKVEGKDHNQVFWVQIQASDKKSALGSGQSKKKAEQDAAKNFINTYFSSKFSKKTFNSNTTLDLKDIGSTSINLPSRNLAERLVSKLELPTWSLNLLILAFVHRSYGSKNKLSIFGSDNRVLALIGSYVLQWASKDAILSIQSPKEIAFKGGISNISKEALTAESLTEACKTYYQKSLYLLGPGEKELNLSIKLEMIQALIGVVFLIKEKEISHFSDLLGSIPELLQHLTNTALTTKTRADILGPKSTLKEICDSCQITVSFDSSTITAKNSISYIPILELSSKYNERNISIKLPEQWSARHTFLGKAVLENRLANIGLSSFHIASGKKDLLKDSDVEISDNLVKWFLEHSFQIVSHRKSLHSRKNKLLIERSELLGLSALKDKNFLRFANWIHYIKEIFGEDLSLKINNSLNFYKRVGSTKNNYISELTLFNDLENLEKFLRNINLLTDSVDIKSSLEFKALIKNASALRFISGKSVEITISDLTAQTELLFKKRLSEIKFPVDASVRLLEIDGAHITLLDLLSQSLDSLSVNPSKIDIEKNGNNLDIKINKNNFQHLNLMNTLSKNSNWNILIKLLPISAISETDLLLKITLPSPIENELSLLSWWSFHLPDSESFNVTNTMASLLHDTKNELLAAISVNDLILKTTQKSEIYQLASNSSRHIEQALAKINAANFVINSSKQLITDGFSLSDFLRSFIASLWTLVPKNIQLITPTTLDDYIFYTNEEALRSILINLIKNSVEAMSNGGRLWIEYLVHEDNILELEIRDSGSGFSESQLELLNNGSILTTSKKDGTGIGLLTVFMLIKELKGELFFKNNVDLGSVITIFIPSQLPDENLAFPDSDQDISEVIDKG